MRKEKSVKKINLCFLAVITAISVGSGIWEVHNVYAEGFSLVPTGEAFEVSAGQAQSFMTNVDVTGVTQALNDLDGQADCQEKVCVCKYRVRVTTLKLRADEVIEQIGVTDSTSYDCRDIKGGVGPAQVAYGVSIAEPGMNYYLNIAQIVSAEGASFGAEGDTRVLGNLEVHQVNVTGGDLGPSGEDDQGKQETDTVEVAEEETEPREAEDDEVIDPIDDAEEEDLVESGAEFTLTGDVLSIGELMSALEVESGSTFIIKVEEGAVLNTAVLDAVKASGKNLSIRKYRGDQLIYEWKIRSDAIDVTKDFDPTVNFGTAEQAKIDQAVSQLETKGDLSKIYFGTMQVGALPAGVKLRILVDTSLVGVAERLNLYNYDADLDEVEVAYESMKINNGFVEFAVARGSQGYFLTPAQIVTVKNEEEKVAGVTEEESSTNWLVLGLLGAFGAGGIGFGGFWIWRKRQKQSNNVTGEDVVVAMAETEEMEPEDDVSVASVTPMSVELTSLPQPVAHTSGKVMDMVRRPQNCRSVADNAVAMKGSSRRLVIS